MMKTFEFDYNDSFLGFKFTAIDYDAPEKIDIFL